MGRGAGREAWPVRRPLRQVCGNRLSRLLAWSPLMFLTVGTGIDDDLQDYQ